MARLPVPPSSSGHLQRTRISSAASRPPAPTAADADHVIIALTSLADQAKAAAPDERAVPPVSTWNWLAIAVIVVPALALLIATFA